MTLTDQIKKIETQYSNCVFFDISDMLRDKPLHQYRNALNTALQPHYKPIYNDNDRLVFVFDYADQSMIAVLQQVLYAIDISNFFCTILIPNKHIDTLKKLLSTHSKDPVPVAVFGYDTESSRNYNDPAPIKIDIQTLSSKHQSLLTENKTFCIYPWIHLHSYPTGETWPCCQADMAAGAVGTTKTHTLEQLWNSERMKQLRINMLNGRQDTLCVRCYEQESAGFLSGRQSANKHHGHHITKVDDTAEDGTLDKFQMTYWDIRFSNFCNLSCRSCGHIFSSSWHQDQKKVLLQSYWDKVRGPDWPVDPPYTTEEFDRLSDCIKHVLLQDFDGEILRHLETVKKLPALYYAGKTEIDMWEQLLPHLDHVEQIYFAGGEPLMMEEHYRILEELEKRERFDVRLVYNTNFTHTRLKDRSVFDYWRKFEKVSVGASLDAMGPRAEYIRNGTKWQKVLANRRRMLEICPEVDFYISPTLSIMNALHLPDFHRAWVEQGLLKPQDLNINILQDPVHYRIDIATAEFKEHVKQRYLEHLAWLQPLDPLNRATVGFKSAIEFMLSTDNSHFLETFWYRTQQLDAIRNQQVLDVLPELAALM